MKNIEEVYIDYLEFLKTRNKITSVKAIEYKFKNHILPYFKRKKINEIKEKEYIEFQIYLKNKFNYSNSFYQSMHTIMKNFFDYITLTYNIENIPLKVGFRNVNNTCYISNQKKGIWDNKTFKKFIKNVDNPIYNCLFCVLFYCGIRKGEALALKISDFKNGSLIINKTITKEFFNGKRQILTPKTVNSIRNVKLDLFTNNQIKKLIKFYKKNYTNYSNEFFLFGGNKPLATTTIERRKDYYCKISNIKPIRIHDFRHSHATFLYKHKIKDKSIQNRLGHADISTTLNTYVHSDSKEEKKLIKMISLFRF